MKLIMDFIIFSLFIYIVTEYPKTLMFILAIVVLWCIGGGIWANIISRKAKINDQKYKAYKDFLVTQQLTQIDNLAAAFGVSYDEAKNGLQEMINDGYFVGAYINESNREIVLPQTILAETSPPYPTAQMPTCVVACKGCGANNTIVIGQAKECEYCGSPMRESRWNQGGESRGEHQGETRGKQGGNQGGDRKKK